jgi:gamma-glutamyltranspeptidase/glutathione hydrolase
MNTRSLGFALIASASLMLAPTGAAQAQASGLLNYPSIHQPMVSEAGMVVSQNELASKIGASMLAKGGNAVDAAVATAFALAVVLPRAGNLGGDGFMLVHLADGDRTIAIDYRGVAPKAAKLDMFVEPDGKLRPDASRGYRAPAVPGTVAGLYLAQSKYGKLKWAEVVQPAIVLAESGVQLSHDDASVLKWGRERLQASDESRMTFFKAGGEPYQAGEILKQPDLAWTLHQIQSGGADAFYRGRVAQKIAADMAAHNGLITADDLASYKPVERAPLIGTYRGLKIYTMPPASAGGVTLIEMLNILETRDVKATGLGSGAEIHLIAETLKLGTADRYAYLGDTAFVKVPLAGLTSKAYAAQLAKQISATSSISARDLKPGDPIPYESPNTTHFSVADRYGNAVSNTFTLGSDFGSGVAVAGAGFILNNQMDNYSHAQAQRAEKTGAPPPPNAMAPGKRMLSTMVPTMVFKGGKPWLVTGSPGGSTIIGTVLQVVVNVVDFDLNVSEAVNAPRINQLRSDELEAEPNFNPDTLAKLKALGHEVKIGQTMGSAQSILIERNSFYGGVDPRRPGAYAASSDGVR